MWCVVATAAGHGVGARAEVWAGAGALSGGKQRLARCTAEREAASSTATRVATEQDRRYKVDTGRAVSRVPGSVIRLNNNLQQHINTLGGGEIQALRHEQPNSPEAN